MLSTNSLRNGLTTILASPPLDIELHHDEIARDITVSEQVSESVNCITSVISYDYFFQKYLLKNQPCLFSGWITQDWRSCDEWKHMNLPNLSLIGDLFGPSKVPVADCRRSEHNAQPKETWTVNQFISYWIESMSGGESVKDKCFYLKDWHFCKEYPDYNAYDLPSYFSSDWLNEASDANCMNCNDDFRFVYMGPKGTWTPFHADVYRSYSWSANICGKKKWLFYPKGKENALRDSNGHLPYDITDIDVPENSELQPIEIVQRSGEIIFVPSGWYHQVFNLEDTISINHNWLNGCNLKMVWDFLRKELSAVEREIDDCRSSMNDVEWYSQCQLIMQANTGINFAGFFSLLKTIATSRIDRSTAHCGTSLSSDNPIFDGYDASLSACRSTLVRLAKSLDEEKQFGDVSNKTLFHDLFDLCSIVPVALLLLDFETSYPEPGTRDHLLRGLRELLSDICFTITSFTDYTNSDSLVRLKSDID